MGAVPCESNRGGPNPLPASIARTTQPMKARPAVGSRNGPRAPLPGVRGRMKGAAAVGATFQSGFDREILINIERPSQKACVQNRVLCRRNATTPCLCCPTRLRAHKIPGPAWWYRPRGSRPFTWQELFMQLVGAQEATDSEFDSEDGVSPSAKVTTHTTRYKSFRARKAIRNSQPSSSPAPLIYKK